RKAERGHLRKLPRALQPAQAKTRRRKDPPGDQPVETPSEKGRQGRPHFETQRYVLQVPRRRKRRQLQLRKVLGTEEDCSLHAKVIATKYNPDARAPGRMTTDA